VIMEADPGVLAIIGTGLLLSAGIMFYNTRKFILDSEKTNGKIIFEGVKEYQDFTKRLFVKIEFEVNNKKYIVESSSSRFQKLTVGSFVEVLCSKSDPNNAKVNMFLQLYFIDCMLLCFGLSFLGGFLSKI